MPKWLRRSAVFFNNTPLSVEIQNGWQVIIECQNEKNGPYLIDLSHRPKWDIQDADLSNFSQWHGNIPVKPGGAIFQNGFLINRLNRTQAVVWHLLGQFPDIGMDKAFTDVTDAFALFAIIGLGAIDLMSKISSLDVGSSLQKSPFMLQGPVAHVPCRVAVLGKNEKKEDCIILIACARGYGQSMAETLLDAGAQWGFRPGGEKAFLKWMAMERSH